MTKVKTIAFYLPQFHPIPENDEWWGKGFTEWTNVVQAQPLYPGHDQPRLPADLGFYDLRVPEVREAQAKLAGAHGIDGFCYYYYWFGGGKKLLSRPIEEVLASGKPDFPFCFCWANESWSRRWDGRDHDTLMTQDNSPATCRSLIQSMAPYFSDKRYIRVDDKPILLVYRADVFDDTKTAIKALRDEARKTLGLELYLVLCEAYGAGKREIEAGFDALYEFPSAYAQTDAVRPGRPDKKFNGPFNGMIRDYAKVADFYKTRPKVDYRRFRGVTLGWDNTARKKSSAVILENFSIEGYGKWLENCVESAREVNNESERLIFINAWNEWAEGTYLEPDQKYGMKYLEMTKSSLARRPNLLPSDGATARQLPKADTPEKKSIPALNPNSQMLYKPYLWRMEELESKVFSAGYFSRPRVELYPGIGDPGKMMLDVGCGSGATSADLKRRYPATKFYGVELNPNMAKLAASQLDVVLSCNFEEVDFEGRDIAGNKFNTILFADVLEHMYNPWKALEYSKKLLAKNGKIVASIPNIFNLQVIENLARGDWNYDKYGILDITHIRFFTLETILRMLKETGFDVTNIYSLPVPKKVLPIFEISDDGVLSTHELSMNNVSEVKLKKLLTLQYVVVARSAG